LHSNAGSGHLAQGGQGLHAFSRGQTEAEGQTGQTGGTISDFRIYKSFCPAGILLEDMPSTVFCWVAATVFPPVAFTTVALPLSPSIVAPLIPSNMLELEPLPKQQHKRRESNKMQNK
tara:strand:+ start:175 stop:528 length:354 start_codon:yes stop_codon:yes gene_type:complete